MKRAWKAGELHGSARAVAKALVASCVERGIQTCGTEHIRIWLAE